MTDIIACLDGSPSAAAVCDYAAWAAKTLSMSLQLLHITEDDDPLAREQGRWILEQGRDRAILAGIEHPHLHQLYGDRSDLLSKLEKHIHLLVLGRSGEHKLAGHLGSLIRNVHQPILVVPEHYREPESLLLAYDGSPTSQRCVDLLASSDLLSNLALHILWVATETPQRRTELEEIEQRMASTGREARLSIRSGEVEETLQRYLDEHAIDMLIMGTYGQSRLRELLLGSTTRHMLQSSHIPLLLIH